MRGVVVACLLAVVGCGGGSALSTPDGGQAGKTGGSAGGHDGVGGGEGGTGGGVSGVAGSIGVAGASGGVSGTAGSAGAPGPTGAAGTAGSAGAGGSVGVAGVGGSAGAAGAAGAAGTGGAGGAGGTGGVSGAAGAAPGSPIALCRQLVATICLRLYLCPGVDQNPGTFSEAECEKTEDVEFGCDRATSNGFPDCLSDVKTISCAGLFSQSSGLQLPPSCDDPINTIPLGTAQSKCADLAAADCMRLFQCRGVTPSADDLQNCQIQDYASAGCGLAIDVGPSYAKCLSDLGTAPCTPMPGAGVPACDNAIVFVQ